MISLLMMIILSAPVIAEEADKQVTAKDNISISGNTEQTSQESDTTSNSEQDFKPDQEISEDYPISLPSDI